MKGNVNKGTNMIGMEPTTDGKIGLEGDSLCWQPINPFLVMYAPM